MKTKAIAILSMLPISMLMFVVPAPARVPPIKIGIMGPMRLTQGQGMREGATLAKTDVGNVLGRRIQLIFSDEFQRQADGTAETGRLAMEYLMAARCDFVIGGFRTESVLGAREVAADNGTIYLVTGAATDEIIDCGRAACTQGAPATWFGGLPATCGAYNFSGPKAGWPLGLAIIPKNPPCGGGFGQPCAGQSVRCNNARYKYTFRVTPVNSSYLAYSVMGIAFLGTQGFLTYAINELKKIFAPTGRLPYAALVENLAWTRGFQMILSNSTLGGLLPQGTATPYLGADVKLVNYFAVSPTATSLTTEMTAIKNGPDGTPGTGDEARLIIHILSNDRVGSAFTTAWNALDVKAIPVGINAYASSPNAWNLTGGAVEYETILAPTGTRTPINSLTTAFWDNYLAMWRRAPIYTAFGAYQAVDMLATCITRANSTDKDLVKAQLEAYNEVTATGRFKFTTNHDVYSGGYGATWTDGYVRPLMCQWQAGRLEVVWPRDKPYSIKWRLPVSLYPLWETDLTRDGLVYAGDMAKVSGAWLTSPGQVGWNLDADMDSNGLIDSSDTDRVAKDWMKTVTIPYIPDP